MYWLMPVGLFCGLLGVIAFERMSGSDWKVSERKALFKSLTGRAEWDELEPCQEELLEKRVDSLDNMAYFWGGGGMSFLSKEQYVKVYEMLALVCALMLNICVVFYTGADVGASKYSYEYSILHVYGIICCLANCALWMACLSSAFFVVAIGACDDEQQVKVLVTMYGTVLMRAPMMLFVWGTTLLFMEFIFYFKIAVDPGFACTMCLTGCFVIVPLFFHLMHKLGWVGRLVRMESDLKERDSANYLTPIQIRDLLDLYVTSKKAKGNPNPFALDYQEFESLIKNQPRNRITTTQLQYAKEVFDRHVSKVMESLHADS